MITLTGYRRQRLGFGYSLLAALTFLLAACGNQATARSGPTEDDTRPPSVETRREMDRYAGATRYETAVEIAQHAFPDGASVVYLARADESADALAAGSLPDGPVLLVPSCGELPDVVRDGLERLDPSKVVALGGPSAICDAMLVQAAGPGAPPPPPSESSTGAPPPPSDWNPEPGDDGLSTPSPADFSVSIATVMPEREEAAGDAAATEGYVELRNSGDVVVELNGWYILDSVDNYLSVSQDHSIAPGQTFQVHVGHGTDTPNRHYNGSGSILEASGDVLRLFRSNKDLIHEYRYP